MKIQVKMVGTGSAYPAFYLKMIDKRRKRILMTMRSQKFLEDNHEFANFLKKNDGSTWTLKEKLSESRNFVHPDDPRKTGSLEQQRYQVKKWLDANEDRRAREKRQIFTIEPGSRKRNFAHMSKMRQDSNKIISDLTADIKVLTAEKKKY